MVGGEMMTCRRRRWSATPEQLMVLQELYRRGLRNPNSFQVRTITSHLSLYGKVETKNVFYWFQNHKARDRQKLRKTMRQLQHRRQESQPNSYADEDAQNCCPKLHDGRCRLDFCSFSHLTPLHQGGRAEDILNVCVIPSCDEVGNTMTRMFDHDWMMGTQTSYGFPPRWTERTPKTLQLFPLEATDIKGSQNSAISSPVLSC